MEESFNKRFARQVVRDSLRVSEGENVYISSIRDALDLAEAMALECDLIGAKPLIVTYSDNYMTKALAEPEERFVEATPKHQLKAIEATDVYIGIGRPALSKAPLPRIGAWRKARKPIGDKMDERKTRWVGISYPTKGRAEETGVSIREQRDAILSALDIDYKELAEKGRAIVDAVSGSKEVHLTSPLGTDVTFQISGRKWLIDDGLISPEDVARGDVGLNLPCGEVFVCPIEESAQGTVFFDVPTNYFGHKITGLRLDFKDGRVVKYDAKVGKDGFRQVLDSATGDKDKIGEFAIGLNPKARFINDILVDEKVLGTVHIAIGDNKGPAYGGKNNSSIHFDLIMTKPTVVIDDKTIMTKGKLSIEDSDQKT